MKTELEQKCSKCGDGFWNRVGSKPSRAGALCPKCRTKKPADNKNSTNTLVVRQAVRSQGQSDLREETDVAHELRAILDDGFHPQEHLPKGTLLQWLTDTTPKGLAEDRRIDAEMAACRLVNREKLALRKLTELQVARAESEAVIVRSQHAVLEHRVEQARLREQIRREMQQALTSSLDEEPEEPVEEKQVEETGEDPEKDPDAWYAMKAQRRKVRQRAVADQAVISEFLSQVRRVFDNRKLERSEQSLRIRSLMDTLARGPEDLPSDIRKFLANMESNKENS